MGKTSRGVERIGRQSIRAQVGSIAADLHRHGQNCQQCHRAGSDVYDHCATWWTMARELHRLRRRLRRYDTPETEGMDTLPGMETPEAIARETARDDTDTPPF